MATRAIVSLSRGDTVVLSEDEMLGRVARTGRIEMQKRSSENLQDIILETQTRCECNSKMGTRNAVDLCGCDLDSWLKIGSSCGPLRIC